MVNKTLTLVAVISIISIVFSGINIYLIFGNYQSTQNIQKDIDDINNRIDANRANIETLEPSEDDPSSNESILEEIVEEFIFLSADSHFGFMHPRHFSEMNDLQVFWQRPHPGPFVWGLIEHESGVINWEDADNVVKKSQDNGVNLLVTIWPFADWDQQKCHVKLSLEKTFEFRELGDYRQKPCDLVAYGNFVNALVERYDGDGINDAPDLLFPVKYWEVSNEPSMQEELVFFTGTPEDYFEILKVTYLAVSIADPEAKVLHGGMAGLTGKEEIFWEEVFRLGGANYFDIANIHCIGFNSETLNAPEFNEFLKKNGVDKPFWVTEAQLSAKDLSEQQLSSEEWAKFLIKSFVTAFEAGAENIFYIGLEDSPSDPETWLIRGTNKQETYSAFKTMVDKIDYFSSVEKLGDGQFMFTVNEKPVYVLWKEIPSQINGLVKVTKWDGQEEIMNVSEINLGDQPMFIEEI